MIEYRVTYDFDCADGYVRTGSIDADNHEHAISIKREVLAMPILHAATPVKIERREVGPWR